MRLTVLGSSGGYPAPDNPNSGFLLEHAGRRLWIDAGTGTFAELQRYADFRAVDALVLSHIHPDHCADVYPLFIAIRNGKDGGSFRLPLYAPPGTQEALGPLLLAGGVAKLAEGFDFATIDSGDAVEVAGFQLSFLRTDHPAHTLAIRAECEGGTLTYSADTGPGVDLAPFARGSDLFVCEATYQEARQGAPVHLTARQAAETALRAGVRHLALTHVWPAFDPQISLAEARKAAGDLPVRWVRSGDAIEIGWNLEAFAP
jgi:ribonuclease BN (tRNA processing enzyme)